MVNDAIRCDQMVGWRFTTPERLAAVPHSSKSERIGRAKGSIMRIDAVIDMRSHADSRHGN
jgi:hypothetical protein